MKPTVCQSLLCALALAAGAHAARQPFSPGDLWSWRTASDPRIAPEGQWIVYVEAWNDRQANTSYSNLWQASSDGRTRKPFTEGAWRDTAPRWSPDGARLAWLSDRGGKPRLRVRRFEGGPETEISTAEAPLTLAWSPDGASLAFTALVAVKPETVAWAPPAILSRISPGPATRRQVFVVPANGQAPARQVSSGAFDYPEEPVWMPDGQSILATRDNGEVWAFRLSGAEPKRIIIEPGLHSSPLPSPDGSKIAWLSTTVNPQSYAIHKLNVMNADGSRTKILTGSLDRDPVHPQWSSDSRTIYFLAGDRGATHVYAARSDGTIRQVTSAPERLDGLSLADNGRAVSVRSNPQEGGDVVTFTVDHVSQTVTLASPNEHLLAERDLGGVEELNYDSSGHPIQAWIVKPPAFDAAREVPPSPRRSRRPARDVRGGFRSPRPDLRRPRLCQCSASIPAGSTGYGEQFGNLLHSRYPGDDYDDLMRGVDTAIAKGFVDPKRLVVAGGLLSAWAIGHTDRFAAAIARRPIVDWVLDVATHPDGARRAKYWMGAMPWEDPEQYRLHSPIYFAKDFKTPTLILAGDPDPESDELYFALRNKKVNASLVRFPDSASPAGRVLELETILAWVDDLQRPAGPAVK